MESVLHPMAAADPPLVRELDRQPGQHDRRWIHLLGADQPEVVEAAPPVDLEQVLASGAGPRDRRVAAEYDRLAEPYAVALGDELEGKPFDRWLLARLAAAAVGGQGLDVGCGPGHIAGYLAERGPRMTGLDLSPNMVAQARARHPDLNVLQGKLHGAADAPGRRPA